MFQFFGVIPVFSVNLTATCLDVTELHLVGVWIVASFQLLLGPCLRCMLKNTMDANDVHMLSTDQ